MGKRGVITAAVITGLATAYFVWLAWDSNLSRAALLFPIVFAINSITGLWALYRISQREHGTLEQAQRLYQAVAQNKIVADELQERLLDMTIKQPLFRTMRGGAPTRKFYDIAFAKMQQGMAQADAYRWYRDQLDDCKLDDFTLHRQFDQAMRYRKSK